ncbi:heme peroxidase [Tanacetum coccineum]
MQLLSLLATFTTFALGQSFRGGGGGTRVGFYRSTCRNVESIVQSAVRTAVQANPTIAPGARLEKSAPPNGFLRGFEVIDAAKSQLETSCPGVVSCADIVALAARDSVVLTGGRSWPVPLGRTDGLVSRASDTANLPAFNDAMTVQIQKFADKGLNIQDLVILVGGHTIGTAACALFSYRLYNFNNTNAPDPDINQAFLPQLRALCPNGGDRLRRVALDTGSVNNFGNSFYDNLRDQAGGNLQQDLKDKGVIDSGCSRHMIGNRSYLTDYEEIDGGFIAFGGNSKGGKLLGKCDLKIVIIKEVSTCLFTKATPDESNLWHRRLGHVNFKTMITSKGKPCIENLIDLKVKVIRCDNRTEFKNRVMNKFCEMKGIKREFSSAMTPQQNIAEAVNTACYVQNRVLVIKPHNKTPYELFLVVAGNQSNGNTGTKACADAGKARVETVPGKDYILLPLWTQDPPFSSSPKDSPDAGFKPSGEEEKKDAEDPGKDSEIPSTEEPRINQEKDASVNNTNNINTVSPTVNAASIEDNVVDENIVYGCADDPNIPELEDIVYSDDDEDVGAEADMNNLDAFMPVSPIPTTRIHKDHPVEQIIRDLNSAPQTRRMTKNLKEHGLFSLVQQRTNHKDFQNCLFACFLSQEEPKKNWKKIRLFLATPHLKRTLCLYQLKSSVLYFMVRYKRSLCFVNQLDLISKFPVRVTKVDKRGKTDKTLFIRRDKCDILLVQVLQVKQKEDGIFISQDKYVTEILKKFGFSDVKTASTPMETHTPFLTRLCACARFQVNLKVAHLHAVKRIFRYLKGQPKLGCRLISWQCKKQTMVANSTTKAEYITTSNCCGQRIIYKGWLKWNLIAARDEIEVKIGNSRVNAAGHYLVQMGKT